jgi:hypothetical protein
MKYRCRTCGSVFNLFTGTVLCGMRHDPSVIVSILRGFAQGTPTLHLADELGLDYSMLLEWRHRLQDSALEASLSRQSAASGDAEAGDAEAGDAEVSDTEVSDTEVSDTEVSDTEVSDTGRLSSSEAEADEMFQNAGQKGTRRPERSDAPRRRANQKKGAERTKTTVHRSAASSRAACRTATGYA